MKKHDEDWTCDFIGKMWDEHVKRIELARELGWSNSYVSMILNGKCKPRYARQKMEAALASVLLKRGMDK